MALDARDLIPSDWDYTNYVKKCNIDTLLREKVEEISENKRVKPVNASVDRENTAPCPPEYDDLARLHHLVKSRKVITILEFGIGKSSIVMGQALSENKSAIDVMGDKKLKLIAHELLISVRSNATIDWHHSQMARARIRVAIKKILKRHGYPPDLESEAIQTVLQQAELFSQKWAA